MWKIIVFLLLFGLYISYSFIVYTKGTENNISVPPAEQATINDGKLLFQKNNCIACHQLYGLGGYLGSDLTTAFSDPNRGEMFMKTFLQAGGRQMPNFHFNKEEIDAIISYLKYVDKTAVTYKNL
jgi:nitric oxide reductase subunit C